MVSTAKKSTAPKPMTGSATLEASPVWSVLTNQHKTAIRALAWASSQDWFENGRLIIWHGLLARFGANVGPVTITRVREDLEALKIIVPTGHDAERAGETFRLTWLPTAEAPASNDFLTVDVDAWNAAKAARPLKPYQQTTIDSIETARTRPDLLDDADVKLLTNIEAMIRNGGRPSERQTWAVNAIRNRVVRGEARKPAPAASAPAATPSPAPAAETLVLPPIKHRERKAPRAKASAPKAAKTIRETAHIPAAEPFAVGATVTHDRYGVGVVMLSDVEKTVVAFRGHKQGYGDNPAIRVLTVALRAD